MKKRLRKELRVGEFREDCFELNVAFKPNVSAAEAETLLNDFIDLIESRDLQFGGGCCPDGLRGVVQGPHRGSATDEDRDAVADWLRSQPLVAGVEAGPLRDSWYGWDD
ncbi:50S ribosome-binding protein YggL [Botrimarina sp.]|uniref:50S ribosome-binding protein YggL n=1 Tax=Botrimarina sp. TaxID=2795802 RepID=UPI0032ED33E9